MRVVFHISALVHAWACHHHDMSCPHQGIMSSSPAIHLRCLWAGPAAREGDQFFHFCHCQRNAISELAKTASCEKIVYSTAYFGHFGGDFCAGSCLWAGWRFLIACNGFVILGVAMLCYAVGWMCFHWKIVHSLCTFCGCHGSHLSLLHPLSPGNRATDKAYTK